MMLNHVSRFSYYNLQIDQIHTVVDQFLRMQPMPSRCEICEHLLFLQLTLVMLFAKGLKRKTVLISKFTAMWFNFTFAFWCSYFVCYIYSILIWNASNVSINGSFAAAFCIYIFGCFLISVLLLGRLVMKNILLATEAGLGNEKPVRLAF